MCAQPTRSATREALQLTVPPRRCLSQTTWCCGHVSMAKQLETSRHRHTRTHTQRETSCGRSSPHIHARPDSGLWKAHMAIGSVPELPVNLRMPPVTFCCSLDSTDPVLLRSGVVSSSSNPITASALRGDLIRFKKSETTKEAKSTKTTTTTTS